MMANDRQDELKGLQRRTDPLADNWMPFHNLALGGCETAGFQKDGIGDCHFADVMDETGAA